MNIIKKKSTLESGVPEPQMTPFIDVIFQILIFFLLAMKFRMTEGNIEMMLPKDKGLHLPPPTFRPNQEARIYICSDPRQNFEEHKKEKQAHQNVLNNMRQSTKIGEIVYCWLEDREGLEKYALYETEEHPDRLKANKDAYETLCRKAKSLLEMIRSTQDSRDLVPAVIDADGLVPFEHTFGIISTPQEMNITDIEIAGDPRSVK